MKFSSLILTANAIITSSDGFMTIVSAFSTSASTLSNNIRYSGSLSTFTSIDKRTSPLASFSQSYSQTIDLNDEFSPRDVQGMEQWALQNGVQKADGVELANSPSDNMDWQLVSYQDLQSGTPILFVPAGMVLSSNNLRQELGRDLESAEYEVCRLGELQEQRLPLFRLMVKILMEYEKGQDSIYFPWLNSLPKRFYNGVAMTETCFDCLPPYASKLAKFERDTFMNFFNGIDQGAIPLSRDTIDNYDACEWAYNVALTRFTEVWQPTRQKYIAPMADMFNHATNPNVEVTFDDQGNCNVYATENIPAGSPLTISLGNPTNPTPIFAKYGFLYNDCRTVFCKALDLQPQIEELGYNYDDLLFQVDTGEIAPKVYDIFLMRILQQSDMNLAAQFYEACTMNNEDAKQNFHQEYFQYTNQALQEHVGQILYDVDVLTQRAQSLDLNTHPRVPVIVAHNNLVRETFTKTQMSLQNMG